MNREREESACIPLLVDLLVCLKIFAAHRSYRRVRQSVDRDFQKKFRNLNWHFFLVGFEGPAALKKNNKKQPLKEQRHTLVWHYCACVCVYARVCIYVYMCVCVCRPRICESRSISLFLSLYLSSGPYLYIYVIFCFLRPYVLLVSKHFCTATKIKQVHHCRWSQPSLPLSSHLKKYPVPTCALCFSAFMFKYGNAFKESVVYFYNRNFPIFLRIDKRIILIQ